VTYQQFGKFRLIVKKTFFTSLFCLLRRVSPKVLCLAEDSAAFLALLLNNVCITKLRTIKRFSALRNVPQDIMEFNESQSPTGIQVHKVYTAVKCSIGNKPLCAVIISCTAPFQPHAIYEFPDQKREKEKYRK